jgi:homoserine O-acetyltransferase
MLRPSLVVLLLAVSALAQSTAPPDSKMPETCSSVKDVSYPIPSEADWTTRDFQFKSGERLPEVRIHYCTLGSPQRGADGKVRNAVLLLHGTGGAGRQFLQPRFAGVLFGPGQLLDATKYFIVMVDNAGHGKSSKPSDGLRMRFPHYDYDDMVELQYRLLIEGLKVDHLRLILGTSMGCMHAWVWGEQHPGFMDALMPLACQPVEIAGRNRMWREMLMNAIRRDPAWQNGDYKEEPQQGLHEAGDILILAGSAPLPLQKQAPTRDQADKLLADREKSATEHVDANDMLYQFDSSRNYNPLPNLEKITAYVMAINSADDFINAPELGIVDREIKRVPKGKFFLIPASEQTRGHTTHTSAAIWQSYLQQLLQESGGLAPGTSITSTATATGNSTQLSPAETRPRPIYTPEPQYTDDARKAKINGQVVLEITVGPDGLVKQARVVRGVYPSLDQSALDTIKTWRFEPGTRNGHPITAVLRIETEFKLW